MEGLRSKEKNSWTQTTVGDCQGEGGLGEMERDIGKINGDGQELHLVW